MLPLRSKYSNEIYISKNLLQSGSSHFNYPDSLYIFHILFDYKQKIRKNSNVFFNIRLHFYFKPAWDCLYDNWNSILKLLIFKFHKNFNSFFFLSIYEDGMLKSSGQFLYTSPYTGNM